MPPLLITIGLSIIIRDLAHIFFGAENRPVPSIYEQTFEVAGTQVSVLQVLLLAVAAVLIVILRLLIYGTKIGRAMRATAQDHEAAYAMGVNVNRVFSISFSLASCLGGQPASWWVCITTPSMPLWALRPGSKDLRPASSEA
jgi:branched-chain amino acid transport system permease protein